jgi:hypothetical protein
VQSKIVSLAMSKDYLSKVKHLRDRLEGYFRG